MALNDYRRKRNFDRTAEPSGGLQALHGDLYVIHKHDARNLHYDLRLQHAGVLLSWAVPKGPSLDPGQKRLAVQVEDHPLEYGEFEGVIPKGEYGAGASAVWDMGRWEPLDADVDEGLKRGKLHFRLHGRKLAGGWKLVRTGGKGGGKNWLLIKDSDDTADPVLDITRSGPESVKSGRSLEEIAADPRAVWTGVREAPATWALPNAREAKLPASMLPELATLTKSVPLGDQWLHEIKFDGYRVLCRIEHGRARLLTRNGKDWTERFPAIAAAAAELPVADALLDGEVVVVRPDGSTDFQALQNVLDGSRQDALTYYLFDMPYCEGHDLSRAPLLARKHALRDLLAERPGPLRYSDHVRGEGATIYREACQRGLEGLISKRAESRYVNRRSKDWLKTKCNQRQEFVIGGYTEPQGSRQGFGALLLGYYENERLRYAGKVGTGFDADTLAALSAQLERRERMTPPFAESPGREEARSAHWVTPDLVAEVEFSEWTGDGRLRHPSFQGLRQDKPAAAVVREKPTGPAPEPARPAAGSGSSRSGGSRAKSAGGATVAEVPLSNPGRILFPEAGISKLELAEFYQAIADWVLPHMVDRPLSLLRCPDGRAGECFFQRHLSDTMPDAISAVSIREKNKTAEHPVIHDLAGLVALVQLGVLEVHPWGARADDPEKPDRLIIDLDPGGGTAWEAVCEGARHVRERLDALGLQSYLKVTGGKGLHVVAPLERRLDWDSLKAFAKAVATEMERESPRLYTANMSKSKRHGRIFVDYLRNGRGATAIAAYSVRARPGAPVAVPLRWDELDGLAAADLYHVNNLRRRLAALKRDPWEGFFELKQSISAAARRKLGL